MTGGLGKVLAVAASLAILGGAPALADCAPRQQLDEAIAGLGGVDFKELPAAFGKMAAIEEQISGHLSDCGSGYLIEAQLTRTGLELEAARQAQQSGSAASVYEALVVDADKPQVLWQAAEALGDLRFDQKRFVDATQAYDQAIEIIKDATKTKTAAVPPEEEVTLLVRAAGQSRVLAAETSTKGIYVAAPTNMRDGKIGGGFSESIRGIRPKERQLALRFVTGKADLTPEGEQGILQFVQVLTQQKPAKVVLVGHTDERGTPEYNMKLSADRAVRIADLLKAKGYAGEIVTIPKGESEKAVIRNESTLDQDQIWAANRRVVWQREEEGATP